MHRAVPGDAPLKIHNDPRLVEEAIHMLAHASRMRWLRYRRRINQLYELTDEEIAIVEGER